MHCSRSQLVALGIITASVAILPSLALTWKLQHHIRPGRKLGRNSFSLSSELSDSYDVAVVGSGIGGMVTAAQLSRQGIKTLLCEKQPYLGGRCGSETITTDKGDLFRFDVGPSLLLLPDIYRNTFKDLGENLDELIELLPVDPFYRCFFEEDGSFIDITPDEILMKQQVEAIEPGCWSSFQLYMNTAKGFLDFGLPVFIEEKFQLAGIWEFLKACLVCLPIFPHSFLLERLFTTKKLRAALSFQDLYVGLSPYEAPAVFSLLQALEFDRKILYPKGGFEKITHALVDSCRKAGVTTATNSEVLRMQPAGTTTTTSTNDDSNTKGRKNANGMHLLQIRQHDPPQWEASSGETNPTTTAAVVAADAKRNNGTIDMINSQDPIRRSNIAVSMTTSPPPQVPTKTANELASSIKQVQARRVVVNMDAPAAEQTLLNGYNANDNSNNNANGNSVADGDSKTRSRNASLRPSCGVVSLNIAFDQKLQALTHHTLFLSKHYRSSWRTVEKAATEWHQQPSRSDSHHGNNDDHTSTSIFNPDAFNFYVHAPSRTDDSVCPDGMDAITVLVPVAPYPASTPSTSTIVINNSSYEENILRQQDAESASNCSSSASGSIGTDTYSHEYGAVVQTILEAVVRRLQAVPGMPSNLSQHIVHIHVRTPPKWSQEFNLHRGAAFGLSHPLSQLAIFRPPIRHERVPNCYRVGASTRPGNGVPLVMVSARLASERVLKDIQSSSSSSPV